MSDGAPLERLNIDDIIARIERAQAETRKFVAERDKLLAEAAKLQRDRGLAPWQATVLAAGGIGALLASAVSIAKTLGWI